MTLPPSLLFLLTQDLECPSGLGRYWPWAKALAKIGHPVEIAALHSDYSALVRRELEQEGVRIRYVGQMHVLKKNNQKKYFPLLRLFMIGFQATKTLLAASLTSRADWIIIGKPHPMNSLAGLGARLLRGKRLFLDCDDFESGSGNFNSFWQKPLISFFEYIMPRLTSQVTTNTHFNRDRMVASGLAPGKIFYLPNGVDPGRFVPSDPEKITALKTRLGLAGKKVIIYVGTLDQVSHPLDLLLNAFAKVSPTVPEARLLLVGGGEYYADLIDQVKREPWGASVVITGRVPPEAVPEYLGLASVAVDPVHDDPAARGRCPLKMFESWMMGIPFITGDVGDRRRLSGLPAASFIIEPGSAEALAQALISLLSDAGRQSFLIERGRRHIEHFYWDKLAGHFSAHLDRTIHEA
jgi:glycosyltransferase involved in cell wall biosynthesis